MPPVRVSRHFLVPLAILLLVASLLTVFSLKSIANDRDSGYEDAFSNYDKTINIAVEKDYYPLSFYESIHGSRLTGYDPEFALAMCLKMKLRCNIIPMNFDEIIPALVFDKVQVAFAGFSKTVERQNYLSFSDTYYMTHAMLITRYREFQSVDLRNDEFRRNFRIAVISGTTEDGYLREHFPDLRYNLMRYRSSKELKQAMYEGKIDFAYVESHLGYDILKNTDYGFYNEVPEVHGGLNKMTSAHIIVSQANSKDMTFINKALKEFKIDGTYSRLRSKYFSFLN